MLTEQQLKQIDVFMKSLNIGEERAKLILDVIISQSIIEDLKEQLADFEGKIVGAMEENSKEIADFEGKLVGTMEKNSKEIIKSIEALKIEALKID